MPVLTRAVAEQVLLNLVRDVIENWDVLEQDFSSDSRLAFRLDQFESWHAVFDALTEEP